MKKALIVALVAGLVAGSLAGPAEAKKKKPKKVERTVEGRYENPTFGVGGVGGLCAGCPSFVSDSKEVFATIEIEDDVSPVGYVEFSYDSDGDGVYDTSETVCGATDGPISIPASTEFVAFPYATPGPFCAGASTAGTIKVTFSNLP